MLGRENFAGTWHLTRQIEDRLAGQRGRFVGTARLTPLGRDELFYAETGTLQLGTGPSMAAERRYRWRFAGDRVAVRFDDGRDFHSFRPIGEGPGTDHPCGADAYRVAYDFTAFPLWTTRWCVSGPRKDYVMHTVHRRA